MAEIRLGYPLFNQAAQPFPRNGCPLAPASKHLPPKPTQTEAEGSDRRSVPGHPVILDMPAHHRLQVTPLLRYRRMHLVPKRRIHFLQLGLPLLTHRLKEIEGLGLPLAPAVSILNGKPSKLDQPGLVRRRTSNLPALLVPQLWVKPMHLQAELRHPLLKIALELLSFRPMLESQDEVVGVPHDHHVSFGTLHPPSLDPKVERVVKIDIGQKRTDTSALYRPYFPAPVLPVFQYTGSEPFLDQCVSKVEMSPLIAELKCPL